MKKIKQFFGLSGDNGQNQQAAQQQQQQAPDASNKENPIPESEIKREKTLHLLEQQIEHFQNRVKLYEQRVVLAQKKMDELLQKNNKAQAKQQFDEIKLYQKQIGNIENRKRAVLNIKIEFEMVEEDRKLIMLIKNVRDEMKTAEKDQEQLQDCLADINEQVNYRQQLEDIWAQTAGIQNSENDDEWNNIVEKHETDKFLQQQANVPTAQIIGVPQVVTQPQANVYQQQQQQQQQ